MNSLNQIILEGNVCRQPELRQSAAGNYVCVMPIAVNRSYRTAKGENTEEVSFFDVATFGKTAEVCSRYATIGRHVRVVGRLKQDRWKNQEGKAQSKVNIIAEHVELLNLPRRQMDGPFPRGGSDAAGTEATLVATNVAAASQQDDDDEEDTVGEEVPAF
ncbi:MAG: single-stranded DNA-binding protein [Treponema sp.]|nr:single-stranded DNA-binding protein [Treponema sp.]